MRIAGLTIGGIQAFLSYLTFMMWPLQDLARVYAEMQHSVASAERVFSLIDSKPDVVDREDAVDPGNIRGRIVFEDVSFQYEEGKPVLEHFNLHIASGEHLAIVGPTGGGKSTIVNLIPRFYDVTAGAIYVDGLDLRQVRQSDLRERIGYIPQKGMLFSGTIESNLRYADEDASPEALQEAADIAQATEFIRAKPEGFASEIAQGGANVSGGQKQRLAIARAIVKKPPIYIFDDSFSALDFKTDAALRKALRLKTGGSTVLIVTQRVATIKGADQIIVLDEGRVVGKGTHQELMQSCEAYREIAYSQLSKEELA